MHLIHDVVGLSFGHFIFLLLVMCFNRTLPKSNGQIMYTESLENENQWKKHRVKARIGKAKKTQLNDAQCIFLSVVCSLASIFSVYTFRCNHYWLSKIPVYSLPFFAAAAAVAFVCLLVKCWSYAFLFFSFVWHQKSVLLTAALTEMEFAELNKYTRVNFELQAEEEKNVVRCKSTFTKIKINTRINKVERPKMEWNELVYVCVCIL